MHTIIGESITRCAAGEGSPTAGIVRGSQGGVVELDGVEAQIDKHIDVAGISGRQRTGCLLCVIGCAQGAIQIAGNDQAAAGWSERQVTDE